MSESRKALSLEQVEAELVIAEQRVRDIYAQERELRAVKRAANQQVDVLARQREALLRGDPNRRRMVIGG